jgi:hypothetical protein
MNLVGLLGASAPTHKDVVITELAAVGALAGFALVFVAVLAGSYQTLLGQLSTERLRPFRIAAKAGLGVFLIGVMTIYVGALWLIEGGDRGGGHGLYVATMVLFLAEFAGLLFVAGVCWVVMFHDPASEGDEAAVTAAEVSAERSNENRRGRSALS